MSVNVVQIEQLFRRDWDWSPRELSEFYRVESALIQAGLKIDTDRGVSDEGDPWFTFCRREDAEVIVHIARIDGIYILAGPTYEGVASGRDIAALVRDLIARHPLAQMQGDDRRGAKIFLHPAALLIAVVATAFFKSSEARALTDDHRPSSDSRGGGVAARSDNFSVVEAHKVVVTDAAQTAIILSAVAAVLQSAPAFEERSATMAINSDLDVDTVAPSHSPVAHVLTSGLYPLGSEVAASETHSDQYASITSSTAVAAPPHIAVDALPLISVLWDLGLNVSAKTSAQHSEDTSGGAIPAYPIQVLAQVSALASTATKIPSQQTQDHASALQATTPTSNADTQDVIDTKSVSQVDHPATALVTVSSPPNNLIDSHSAPVTSLLTLPPNDQITAQASHSNKPVVSTADKPADDGTHTSSAAGPSQPASSSPTASASTVSQLSAAPTSVDSSALASADTSAPPSTAPADTGAPPSTSQVLSIPAHVQVSLDHTQIDSPVKQTPDAAIHTAPAVTIHPVEGYGNGPVYDTSPANHASVGSNGPVYDSASLVIGANGPVSLVGVPVVIHS